MEEVTQEFLEHTHIAVFGVSDKKNHIGYKILQKLSKAGYKVFPINPRIAKIGTQRCYGTLDEIPATPQGIVVTLAPEAAIEVVKVSLAHGIRRFWIEPMSVSDELLVFLGDRGINAVHSLEIIEALKK